jgi:dephospho-CoA kinase
VAKPVVIGMLGGVASGKSTVASLFGELGAVVIDADKLAHDVLASREVCEKMRAAWGDEIFDDAGKPDRAKIGERVFANPAMLEQLTNWVHPPTRAAMRAALDEALTEAVAPMVVIDAPLVLEAKLDAWCDRLVLVTADSNTRCARAQADRGWREDEIERRETQQKSLTEKGAAADDEIENDGPLEQLRAKTEALFRKLTHITLEDQTTPQGG